MSSGDAFALIQRLPVREVDRKPVGTTGRRCGWFLRLADKAIIDRKLVARGRRRWPVAMGEDATVPERGDEPTGDGTASAGGRRASAVFRLGDGDRVAGYRIEALVGTGGMGSVYRARDERLRRQIALKLLAPQLAREEGFEQRFFREARAAARVDHPNIIPIYDAGTDAGLLYIAMRYVRGGDVQSLLNREGALSPERTMAIVA